MSAPRSGEGHPPEGCTCIINRWAEAHPHFDDGSGPRLYWTLYEAYEDCPHHGAYARAHRPRSGTAESP